MNSNHWLFPVGEAYSGTVPGEIHAEIRRLKLLLREHCRGPYDQTGVQIGLAVFVQGINEIKPMTRKGIRIDSLRDNAIGADIYIYRTDWDVPPSEFRRFLWRNTEEGVAACIDKLNKKYGIRIAEDKLRHHLSLVRNEFLKEEGVRNDSAAKNQPPASEDSNEPNEHQVIVQYRVDSSGTANDLKKRHSIENLLGEFLENSDLGYCDGGDIGSGTMNIFCFVKPAQNGANAIVDTLRKNDLLDGAVVAESTDGEEKVIWPEDFKGELQLIDR